MKQRKQMRVYDLYRSVIVGKATKIRGIQRYWCNDDVTRVCIIFDGDPALWAFLCRDEQDHKNIIRCVNRILQFINAEEHDAALIEYSDYNKEYHRRWADEN